MSGPDSCPTPKHTRAEHLRTVARVVAWQFERGWTLRQRWSLVMCAAENLAAAVRR